jgi:hypothetical protein
LADPTKLLPGLGTDSAGLDDEHIYLQDPETGGERKIGREDFLKVWFDFAGRACINSRSVL